MYSHKNGLHLRKIGEEHLGILLDAKNKSWTTQHRTRFLNSSDQKKWFQNMGDDIHLIASHDIDGSELDVGLVSVSNIDWISRVASVGMMAFPDARGSSVTKKLPEAITDFSFEVLNLNRLEAEVLENNPAALLFDLKVGYQIEGRKRSAVYKSGKYHDSLIISMLREDWENSERVKGMGNLCNINYKERKSIDRVVDRIKRTGSTSI